MNRGPARKEELYGFHAKSFCLFLERSAKSTLLCILLLPRAAAGVLETKSNSTAVKK